MIYFFAYEYCGVPYQLFVHTHSSQPATEVVEEANTLFVVDPTSIQLSKLHTRIEPETPAGELWVVEEVELLHWLHEEVGEQLIIQQEHNLPRYQWKTLRKYAP